MRGPVCDSASLGGRGQCAYSGVGRNAHSDSVLRRAPHRWESLAARPGMRLPWLWIVVHLRRVDEGAVEGLLRHRCHDPGCAALTSSGDSRQKNAFVRSFDPANDQDASRPRSMA